MISSGFDGAGTYCPITPSGTYFLLVSLLVMPRLSRGLGGSFLSDPAINPHLVVFTPADGHSVLIYSCFIDCVKAFDCVDHNKLENSSRDGNTRPSDLPLEKSELKSGRNS